MGEIDLSPIPRSSVFVAGRCRARCTCNPVLLETGSVVTQSTTQNARRESARVMRCGMMVARMGSSHLFRANPVRDHGPRHELLSVTQRNQAVTRNATQKA